MHGRRNGLRHDVGDVAAFEPKSVVSAFKDFLQACEGLTIRSLYSDLDEFTMEKAQARRDRWIGLLAERVAENAGLPGEKEPALPNAVI
jgi:hypothetical protein